MLLHVCLLTNYLAIDIFFNTMDIDFDCIIAYKSDTDDHSN